MSARSAARRMGAQRRAAWESSGSASYRAAQQQTSRPSSVTGFIATADAAASRQASTLARSRCVRLAPRQCCARRRCNAIVARPVRAICPTHMRRTQHTAAFPPLRVHLHTGGSCRSTACGRSQRARPPCWPARLLPATACWRSTTKVGARWRTAALRVGGQVAALPRAMHDRQ